MPDSEFHPEFLSALREARHIAVLTGAGVSAESGVPTFRDALTGLWSKYDPMQLATPEAFARDPDTISRWYDERRLNVLKCKPNPAHLALAQWQQMLTEQGRTFTLITQNVDRLHQAAGSTSVIEIHGSLLEWRCQVTQRVFEYRGGAFPHYPMRSEAGGLLRPNVVWFGEALPEDAARAAEHAAGFCDVFISIGTSALVYPAAGYLHMAKASGAITAEINRDPTPATETVDYSMLGRAGGIMPALVVACAAAQGSR